ncbi:MAG: hypothetical protein AAF763_14805 [Pseudomonadota bacterium]
MTVLRFAAAAAAALATTAPAAAFTISNIETSDVGLWGSGNVPIHGQTFEAPAVNVLDTARFTIDDGGDDIAFAAYLYAWDDAARSVDGGPLGSVLGLSTGALDVKTDYQVDFGGVPLTPGEDYVVFFEALSEGQAIWSYGPAGGYGDGAFRYLQATLADVGDEWGPGFDGDLDFTFAFSEPAAPSSDVPVPAALPLFAAALGAFGLVRSRRRA